ncbi:MAG: YitT family protein [Muribaculaceae bacterium]|nr:YitT family protein [Muribaculaceae bacterium]
MGKINNNMITHVKDYIMITVGLLCYCFGYSAFLLPEKIVTGGVTGLASLLYFGVGWNVAITYYAINAILLAIAFRTVGKQFVIRTVIGATIATLLLGIMVPLFKEPIVAQQPFMNVIIGAVLCGMGLGIVFTHNGSSAGTDIIAAMVTKHSNISFGRTMIYVDLLIISSSYLIFHTLDKIVYGLIFMFICSIAADMVIDSNRQSVQFMIFSKKWKEIANAITQEAHRGCTVLTGTGWYTQQEATILLVMSRNYESMHIFRIIKAIDPDAFVSQAKIKGVYGEGFDHVKVNLKKEEAEKISSQASRSSSDSQMPTL